MISFIFRILTKTIGAIHWPYSSKKFNLADFQGIENKLKNLPMALLLVTTYGSFGSNILIRLGQWLGLWAWSTKTHVLIYIGGGRVIEASGSEGIRVVSLLEAIGQRDEVKIKIPILPAKVYIEMINFLEGIIESDIKKPILYDNDHNLLDKTAFDCSELLFHALNFGLEANQMQKIKPIMRFGRKTFTPIDADYLAVFATIYDSQRI